ncbi:hypothetical protein A2U01_0067094, partial [Trifolium medium]|nr:hypothetical protein [Trifolium medium]
EFDDEDEARYSLFSNPNPRLRCSFAAKKDHKMVLEVFLIMMVVAVVSDDIDDDDDDEGMGC